MITGSYQCSAKYKDQDQDKFDSVGLEANGKGFELPKNKRIELVKAFEEGGKVDSPIMGFSKLRPGDENILGSEIDSFRNILSLKLDGSKKPISKGGASLRVFQYSPSNSPSALQANLQLPASGSRELALSPLRQFSKNSKNFQASETEQDLSRSFEDRFKEYAKEYDEAHDDQKELLVEILSVVEECKEGTLNLMSGRTIDVPRRRRSRKKKKGIAPIELSNMYSAVFEEDQLKDEDTEQSQSNRELPEQTSAGVFENLSNAAFENQRELEIMELVRQKLKEQENLRNQIEENTDLEDKKTRAPGEKTPNINPLVSCLSGSDLSLDCGEDTKPFPDPEVLSRHLLSSRGHTATKQKHIFLRSSKEDYQSSSSIKFTERTLKPLDLDRINTFEEEEEGCLSQRDYISKNHHRRIVSDRGVSKDFGHFS